MNQQPTLPGLCGRAAVVHTITYMFMGIIASAVLNYKTDFARPEMACWMRQFDDPILRAGVLFQPDSRRPLWARLLPAARNGLRQKERLAHNMVAAGGSRYSWYFRSGARLAGGNDLHPDPGSI